MIDPVYIRMSLEELTTPKEGCITRINRWWIVTQERKVLFFWGSSKKPHYNTPRCNFDKSTADYQIKKFHPDCTVEFIPIAYIPHDCKNFT